MVCLSLETCSRAVGYAYLLFSCHDLFFFFFFCESLVRILSCVMSTMY